MLDRCMFCGRHLVNDSGPVSGLCAKHLLIEYMKRKHGFIYDETSL